MLLFIIANVFVPFLDAIRFGLLISSSLFHVYPLFTLLCVFIHESQLGSYLTISSLLSLLSLCPSFDSLFLHIHTSGGFGLGLGF